MKRFFGPQLLFVIALTLPLLLSGCFSGRTSPKYNSLSNQGILALSTSNPYLGTNLFLAHELERSSYLYRFFEGRGAPTAIEVLEKGFSTPRLLLFYPKDREAYAGDLYHTETQHQWIIRGPFQIEREDYRKLARLETAMVGEPVFAIWGKPHRFRFQSSSHPVIAMKPSVPAPARIRKTPKVKKGSGKTEAKANPEEKKKKDDELPFDLKDFYRLNTDQKALLLSQGYAPRAENGDLLHTVRTEDEDLKMIAKWYTGSPGNAGKIAKANELDDSAPLTVGLQIRVPDSMVKQSKAMPIRSSS